MIEWIRKQITLQLVLTVLLLFVAFFRNSTAWVIDLADSSGKTATAVTRLADQIQALTIRVDVLERAQFAQEQTTAQTFPRRSELEPRLKAIEDNGRENNIMLRRFMENYRR